MRTRQEEAISENALLLFPLMKHLLRGDPGDHALAPFKNQTYHVLRVLERHGPLPTSAIGKRLFIAKQNMTTLIDKLMGDGLVERKNDADDRRVINIVITEKGIEFLKGIMLALKDIIKGNLSHLSDDDIGALHAAFQVVKTVATKLERGERHASD
jgi:DNA-binding MarR family transcriptional regulator